MLSMGVTIFLKRFDKFAVLYVGGETVTDFEEVYLEHFSEVYKYVLTLCRNEAIAEEITQETFFKAMKNIDQFNGSCHLFVWLCQIAKNTYFSFSKKQKRIVSDIDVDLPDVTADLRKGLL
jgi:RNA polymerase sigma factor (sigma-70 family)